MSSSNSCLGKIAFKNRSDPRKHCWNMELETLVFARFVSYFVEPKKLTRLLKGWKFCRHSSELIQHFFPAVYVWNSNKESADTERTATNKQGSDSSRSIAVSPWLRDDFPRPVKRVEGSGESEKEKCKFLGGRSAPIGGGGRGCRGSSRLFLDPKPAKTLQSDAFATQVKATAWKIWKGIQFATSTQLSFLLLWLL